MGDEDDSMLEALINFKLSMIHKKPKNEVIEKFNIYSKQYDALGGQASVMDKSDFRDLKHDFVRYISSSREESDGKRKE